MPKAILEFNLPEDGEYFEMHMNASKYFCAINDIKHYIRQLNKYDERDTIPKEELTHNLYALLDDVSD